MSNEVSKDIRRGKKEPKIQDDKISYVLLLPRPLVVIHYKMREKIDKKQNFKLIGL